MSRAARLAALAGTTGTIALMGSLFPAGALANFSEFYGGYCNIAYFGGQFVWARGYNQSGTSWVVSGFAET
jgi:hypothetical protein